MKILVKTMGLVLVLFVSNAFAGVQMCSFRAGVSGAKCGKKVGAGCTTDGGLSGSVVTGSGGAFHCHYKRAPGKSVQFNNFQKKKSKGKSRK